MNQLEGKGNGSGSWFRIRKGQAEGLDLFSLMKPIPGETVFGLRLTNVVVAYKLSQRKVVDQFIT